MSRSHRQGYDSDDNHSEDIWVMPDDIDYTDNSTNLRKLKRVSKSINGPGAGTVASPPLCIRPVGVIQTTEELQQQQAIASFITTLLVSHPMNAKLSSNDKGIVLRVENPGAQCQDVIYPRGITADLYEKMWPKRRFHPHPKSANGKEHIAGTPYVYEDEFGDKMEIVGDSNSMSSAVPKTRAPRRSRQAIMHDTLKSGSDIHKKLELYTRVYINTLQKYGNVDKVVDIFKEQLRILNIGASDKDMEDIDAILGLYELAAYQFIPVATELPVCDVNKIGEYLKHRNERSEWKKALSALGNAAYRPGFGRKQQQQQSPNDMSAEYEAAPGFVLYGTSIDTLVFCPRQGALGFIELKTSRGNFVKSSHNMEWPLDWLSDSALNCASVQLTLGIEYFKRTYGDILKRNGLPTNLYGFVISVDVANDRSKTTSEIYTLFPETQEKILASLNRTEFVTHLTLPTSK